MQNTQDSAEYPEKMKILNNQKNFAKFVLVSNANEKFKTTYQTCKQELDILCQHEPDSTP